MVQPAAGGGGQEATQMVHVGAMGKSLQFSRSEET